MKVLHVVPYFFVDWAGGREGKPVETVYGPSKALTKRGHDVAIYTTNAFNKIKTSQGDSFLDVDGIRVHEFNSLTRRWSLPVHFYVSPTLIPMFKKTVSTFDVIHLHEWLTFQNIVAHRYCKKYAIPYILQAHGSAAQSYQKGMLKKIFKFLWGYRILRDATKLIALTPTEAEQYKSMGISEDKIEIVPNGIDLAEFENLPQRGQFRKKYGLDDAQKVVLYLARIHKIKGPDLLAKAFAELPKDLGNAKLVIAGPDDGYLATLKELVRELKIEEEVMFTGPLYGRDKLEAYVDADVYVLPSVYETFPVSVVETCACGTPVIVTDRCGIADIVDGQVGFVVPYDRDQLTNAISHMLTDDKLRREFGEKGKLLVREKFNWEKIAELMENVYLSCLASRR
jgi:glycosyltransferase involved in cell wall biosynthesis